ncbi:MAG TPA: hemerythrin domain-containing protein [Chitinophagaceae bacterium]|jgi:iron-sulfur cluster repair protein YtfE (RIC family)|nr:hemerythrin domain-containing protein [Chitinophagaceae bacterium]
MKESNPIKRHNAIVSFSKDHHFGLLLGWKITQGLKKGISPERISNYVIYFFENDLDQHFKEEESLLFTLLPPADPLRKKAEAQHRSIFRIVTAIKANKEQTTLLQQLAYELEEHIRFEERELFNYIQQQVPVAELEKISSRQTNKSREVEDAWEDVFWENSPPSRSL